MFYDTQQQLSCSHLHHVHEVPLVHECVAPIYPSEEPLHDYGRDHGHDRGHVDDHVVTIIIMTATVAMMFMIMVVTMLFTMIVFMGIFIFHIFTHLKPPRGLHRPTNKNKKHILLLIHFKSTTMMGF